MKQCNHCGEYKTEDEFSWRWKNKGIRQNACKSCKAKQDNKWYKSRSTEHIQNVTDRRREKIQDARRYVWDYLSTHPCVDCGETDPTVLEFDHVRGRKTKTISELAGQGYSIGRIQKEINKCEVRCANCHRRKTSEDRGWFRM